MTNLCLAKAHLIVCVLEEFFYGTLSVETKSRSTQPLKCQSGLQQMTFKILFHCFSEKIRLDVSSESSARQRIHMKNQALFSSKDKS